MAVEKFRAAYEAYQDPAFLYNIAQCYRNLGRHEEAISFYRNYLRRSASVPDHIRSQVETRIAELQKLAARSRPPSEKASPGAEATTLDKPLPPAASPAAAAPAPTSLPTAPLPPTSGTLAAAAKPAHDDPPVYTRWWFWTAVGAVAVAVVIVGVVAASNDAEIPSSPQGWKDFGP